MAAYSRAQWFACLRIALAVTPDGARLVTGRPGSAFTGRIPPLDDRLNFRRDRTPVPSDQPFLVALQVQHTGRLLTVLREQDLSEVIYLHGEPPGLEPRTLDLKKLLRQLLLMIIE